MNHLLELKAVDLFAVSLLMQDLGQLFQVPQSPRIVPHSRSQEPVNPLLKLPKILRNHSLITGVPGPSFTVIKLIDLQCCTAGRSRLFVDKFILF